MTDKLAVCVGNNYPGTDYELSGCRNDALDWAALLGDQGYETVVLFEPTAAQLMGELETAIARVGWGDRLVFTYSGHGTWVPDTDGDEADRRDEAMVMHELELVTDDELQRLFAGVHTGAGALILSDSCHSGTVSRFLEAPADPDSPRGRAIRTRRPRFLPPTMFAPNLSEARARTLEQTRAGIPRKTVNLISGCADPEYSYDAWFTDPVDGTDRPNGAFTRAAIDAYRPGQSLARWFRRIRANLPNDDYPQSPQLTTTSLYRRYARAL